MSFQATHDGNFAARMREVARQLHTFVEDVVRSYATTFIVEVNTLDTPIRTGQARANWRVASNTPSSDWLKFQPYRSNPGAVTGALEQAIDAIGAWHLGEPLYLYNNAPYIIRLNQGYSAQAPAGFIETALLRAQATLTNVQAMRS